MLPAYFGNMAPVIFKNLNFIKTPVDFGANFLDGKPIFGKNKTIQGIIFATVFGIIVAYVQYTLYQNNLFKGLSLIDYSNWMQIGFLFGFGAIFGDLVKSFFKRRVNIKPGQPFIPFDQIDFVIGALFFVYFTGILTWQIVITLLIVSPILHITVNHIAYYTHIRGEKW